MASLEKLRENWQEAVDAYSLHWFLNTKLKGLFYKDFDEPEGSTIYIVHDFEDLDSHLLRYSLGLPVVAHPWAKGRQSQGGLRWWET